MKPKVQTLGAAVARGRRDSGQVRPSTFIPLKIRKRGGSKVVVRPDGRVDTVARIELGHFSPRHFAAQSNRSHGYHQPYHPDRRLVADNIGADLALGDWVRAIILCFVGCACA